MGADELRERVPIPGAGTVDQPVFGNRGAQTQGGNPSTACERTAPEGAVRREGSALVEIERGGVDADPLARFAGPVAEYVPEVAAADRTGHLDAMHAVAVIV